MRAGERVEGSDLGVLEARPLGGGDGQRAACLGVGDARRDQRLRGPLHRRQRLRYRGAQLTLYLHGEALDILRVVGKLHSG